ncbi:hypothetical protein BDD12DRAFT_298946 [Trichophaea hybrida]|nr:hypothetical protein BDD12DRAFT_298946 [Trichophaea hybrida]
MPILRCLFFSADSTESIWLHIWGASDLRPTIARRVVYIFCTPRHHRLQYWYILVLKYRLRTLVAITTAIASVRRLLVWLDPWPIALEEVHGLKKPRNCYCCLKLDPHPPGCLRTVLSTYPPIYLPVLCLPTLLLSYYLPKVPTYPLYSYPPQLLQPLRTPLYSYRLHCHRRRNRSRSHSVEFRSRAHPHLQPFLITLIPTFCVRFLAFFTVALRLLSSRILTYRKRSTTKDFRYRQPALRADCVATVY